MNTSVKMNSASYRERPTEVPGDKVIFHGLVGAAHLNGTEGKLINFIESEQRWCVRCLGEDAKVTAKPENLQIQFE